MVLTLAELFDSIGEAASAWADMVVCRHKPCGTRSHGASVGIGSSVRIAAGPGAETVAGMETQVGTGLIDRIGQDTVIVRRAPIVLKNSTVRSVRIGPAADATGRAIPSI